MIMKEQIERLIRENQAQILRDRRAQQRQPFARPVTLYIGRNLNEPWRAFSRDLSHEGLSLISELSWEVGRVATVDIHALSGPPVRLRAEVRWSEPFGKGWYLSGWHFLDSGV